ncbi:MAG: hypothetical protein HC767_10040 [Akkermansiaceae bacterium]|nr:hypothetical protein [Akkermansiaceae bacterium]
MQAQDMGLEHALHTANSYLNSRRSALVREIHLARKGGKMVVLQALRSQAVALDMQDVLLSVDSTLQAHVAVAEQKLQAAAATCFSSSLFLSHMEVQFHALCHVEMPSAVGNSSAPRAPSPDRY